MWARAYSGSRRGLQPWTQLSASLREAPLAPLRDDLQAELSALLTEELARDPELEELASSSHLIDMIEAALTRRLPWYGGAVVSIRNTALTGWRPGDAFLVQDIPGERITHSVGALLDALDRLPTWLGALGQAFAPVRAAIARGEAPIDELEIILDLVVQATGCQDDWASTLFATWLWMHEAIGVPLPEQRRAAMQDWLHQTCPPGNPPAPQTRAEILSGLALSLRRPTRY